MKKRTQFRTNTILGLLVATIPVYFLSVYFFWRVDQIVLGDLYRYGLQFSFDWAGRYWTYSRLVTSSVAITMSLTFISMIIVLVYARTRGNGLRSVSCLLLALGIASTGLSAFFFNRLDYLVTHDIYRYGLQFSTEWAVPYWTYARLILGLMGFASTITVISIAMILRGINSHEGRFLIGTYALSTVGKTRLICSVLFLVGAGALAWSIYYTSSILAFIGLGLVFWGALLLYITPVRHVELELLNATALSLINDIDKVVATTELNSKGIYLPPKYLKDFESSLLFAPLGLPRVKLALPKPEEVQEEKIFSENPNYMFLSPLGLTLSKYLEKKLGTSFIQTNINQLEERLPKLLTEDADIAENMEMFTRDNIVTIEMKNHVFRGACEETRKHEKLHELMGCQLCSAIACALAKATGRPIMIEDEEQSQNGKITKIRYRILEE